MTRPETHGFGSALRWVYRPVGYVADAFDFLTAADDDTFQAPTPYQTEVQVAESIETMRAAANALSDVAKTVMDRAQPSEPPAHQPTARQVIEDATDEAANFHA